MPSGASMMAWSWRQDVADGIGNGPLLVRPETPPNALRRRLRGDPLPNADQVVGTKLLREAVPLIVGALIIVASQSRRADSFLNCPATARGTG